MLDPEDFGLGPAATLAHIGAAPAPAGFGAFWAHAVAQLLEDAPEPEIAPRHTPDPTDPSCSHEVTGLGGVRLGAGLFVPDDLPVRAGLVTLHGAGVPRAMAEESDRWRRLLARGVAVLAVRVRGFPGSARDCPELDPAPPELWATVGLDRDGHAHHDTDADSQHTDHALLGWSVAGAALDVLASCMALRRWLDEHGSHDDGRPALMLRGESLGGGLGVIAAALAETYAPDAAPERLSIGLPTFGDWAFRDAHPGYGQGRAIAETVRHARERGAEIERRLRFVDAVTHARAVHAPVLAKLAVRDEVVPAPAGAAVFNALGTPAVLRWRFVTPFGHHEGGIAHARREALFERCLLDYLDPANDPRAAMRRWLPVLERGDRLPSPQPSPGAPSPAADGLFGDDDLTPGRDGLSPFDRAIVAEYRRVGRTLDDLPYTDEFESLYAGAGAQTLNRTRREVFHRLHNLRKAGKLPRMGRSGEPRPVIADRDEGALTELVTALAGTLGQRDRLPYTPEMDRLAETFRERTGSDLGLHELWRVIAKLAK